MVTLRAETGKLSLVGDRGLANALAEAAVTITHPMITADGMSWGVRVYTHQFEHAVDFGWPSHSVSVVAMHFDRRTYFPGAVLVVTDVTRACLPVVPATDHTMGPQRPQYLSAARQDVRHSAIIGTSELRDALAALRVQARAACRDSGLSMGRVVRWEFFRPTAAATQANSFPAPALDAGVLLLRTRLHDKKSPKRTRRRKAQVVSVRVDAEVNGAWPTVTTRWSALNNVLRQVRTSSIRLELDDTSSCLRVAAQGAWPVAPSITAYDAVVPLVRRELPVKLRQLNVRREAAVADLRDLIRLRDTGQLDEHDEERAREEELVAERRRAKQEEGNAVGQRLEDMRRRTRIDI